jgi:phage terminase large subunit-like protein
MRIEDFAGQKAWVGLDLGATKDLTARAVIFPDGMDSENRPKFALFAKGYTPADTIHAREDADKAPYSVWASEGYLDLLPGKVIRLDFVARDLVDLSHNVDVAAVAYDQWLIRDFAFNLDALGVTLPLIEHPQGTNRRKDSPLWMPGSIDMLERLILEKRIRIAVNPALRSAVFSATFWQSPAGLRRFEKQRATGRIDMAVAAAMAVGAATSEDEPVQETYLSRRDPVLI